MTGRGYLFALDPDDARLAQACASGADLDAFLEHLHRSTATTELDKAWLLIDRCLATMRSPLAAALLGARPLLDAPDRVARFVPPQEVGAVADALAVVDEDTFRACFEGSAPPEPDGESQELDLLYSWSWFQRLRAHFHDAAAAGRAVLFAGERRPGAWSALVDASGYVPGHVAGRPRTTASA